MKIVVETDSNLRECALPVEGEVWLLVEKGMLYEMRGWVIPTDRSGPHRAAYRIGAGEYSYGCDPTVFVAVFDHDVRNGKWTRVENCPKYGSLVGCHLGCGGRIVEYQTPGESPGGELCASCGIKGRPLARVPA